MGHGVPLTAVLKPQPHQTLSSSRRPGMPAESRLWSANTSGFCRPATGPTGCWATTTSHGWRAASGRRRRARHDAAADPARHPDDLTRATHSASRTCPPSFARRAIPGSATNRASVSGRTRSAPPCRGTAARARASRRRRPGCPSARATGPRNAAAQEQDAASVLSLTRELIALRRSSPALTEGDYHAVETEGDLFAFERRLGGERLLVVLNLGRAEVVAPFGLPAGARVLLSTLSRPATTAPPLSLRPDEGLVGGRRPPDEPFGLPRIALSGKRRLPLQGGAA